MDNRKGTGNGIWNIMQLVGYSNKLTFESNAILLWIKYLRENIGQERCSKKWIYACLVEMTEVESSKNFGSTSTPRSTEAQTTPERNK